MTSDSKPPSEVMGRRVQEVRRRRGWTASQLADRCSEIGAPKLTAQAIANIENGRKDKITGRRRRDITIDELMALATALEVAPVHLLVPLDDDTAYEVTPEREVPAFAARDFVRGFTPLGGMDVRWLWSEMPANEYLEVGHRGDAFLATFERGGGRHGYRVSFGGRDGDDGEG